MPRNKQDDTYREVNIVRSGEPHKPGPRRDFSRRRSGFSMLEMIASMAIMLIVAAFAIPTVMSMVHQGRLRGSASDFDGLVQAARIRAVRDNRFYSVYILGSEGFVDIYPQSYTGASGSGGTTIDSRDPAIAISLEVSTIAAAAAPDTSNLQGQFLPSGSTVTPGDGTASGSPITFGPRGLPCTSQTTTGGTVCDSAGGATAFWVFFQDTTTKEYGAVTVSPAGRVRRWYHGTGGWNGL